MSIDKNILDIVYLFIPIFALALNIIFHLIIFKISDYTIVLSDIIAFIIGIVFVVICNIFLILFFVPFSVDSIVRVASNIIFFMTMGFLYFALINIGESSLRIRILTIINESKEGITEKEIFEKYNSIEILKNRIKRMTKNGQIIEKNDRYYFGKPRLIYVAKIFEYLRLVLIGNKFDY